MHNHAVSEVKFFGLLGNLKEEVKLFFKEEIKLAKTELSEKVSKMGKNAVSLVIGGFVAYAGVLVFFAGIASIIAYLFERGGMNHTFANFVGFGIMGFIVDAAKWADGKIRNTVITPKPSRFSRPAWSRYS